MSLVTGFTEKTARDFYSVCGEPNGQVGQDESMLRNNVVPLPEEIVVSNKWGLT